jgi:hypothetical protein
MKGSEDFKKTIKNYLDSEATFDELFAEHYKKEAKNIDDCITYILNYVQKSKVCGFADNEIFSLAKHYYIEDVIEVGDKVNCQVIVNHKVELTEEEILEAKEKAKQDVYNTQKQSMTQKPIITKPKQVEDIKQPQVQQQSLF